MSGLSHLPGKHRVSRVPHRKAEALRALVSGFLLLHGPNQEASFPLRNLKTPSRMYTHHTLPEQEAIGCGGSNLEFDGLRCFRKAAGVGSEGVRGIQGRKQCVRRSLSLKLMLTRLDP